MSHQLLPLLKQYFGYDTLRPLQGEIMAASLAGEDTVAILPTGAGKSLCYQLPALVRKGLTLVVSPLIALMKDQVDQLTAAGVAATFLNSTVDGRESMHRMDGLRRGDYRLLYVAPERLMMPDFLERLRTWQLEALAVDEAHCISEWGHDFRPEYRQLATVREMFVGVPFIALTATATPRVRADIVSQLRLRDARIFVAGFNRPNLSYRVMPKQKSERQVWDWARSRPDECGIVYCQARKTADAMAAMLVAEGLPAVAYHAGMDADLRGKNQEAFLRDEARIVCATIAFGMGINKPNVRWVIHADLPKNMEGYYQETGRAGRDGLPADCLLLFSRADIVKQQHFFGEITDQQARQVAERQLRSMAEYADAGDCRRAVLLRYFGEDWQEENCGNCDNCLEPRETWDATLDAQKFLSCLFRIRQHSGFSTGLLHVADVLCGGDTDKIRNWRHNELSTYAVGKDKPRKDWIDLGRQLIRLGLAGEDAEKFGVIHITAAGTATLKQRTPVSLIRSPMQKLEAKPISTGTAARAGAIACDEDLFATLRTLRKSLADERNVPSYVIFSDVTLRHMAREYPLTDVEFLGLPGVGERKRADFGEAFLSAIRTWLVDHERRVFPRESLQSAPGASMKSDNFLSGTAAESLRRYQAGANVSAIAQERNFVESTILSHLARAIETGVNLDPREFYTLEEEASILQAMEGHQGDAMGPIFEKLGGSISYGKIRMCNAFARRSKENAPA